MRPTVLVLEDEEGIRQLVRDGLEEEGYDVVAVATIAEAEAAQPEGGYDLYVLDLAVPDGNGLRYAREIRRSSSAGIIFLTGRGDETDRVIGLESGGDDYEVKPLLPRELRARVNAVFRRTGPAAGETGAGPGAHGEATISFHGMALSPASRTVFDAGGEELGLTTLEFEVLHVLLRKPTAS